tara:strand:- start:1867 stop:3663 length:1797 start_codon:yes stop_codon:yes gene_type:complete
MALTTGNIDQQIRDKVDSGRSNPAKLQNEYKLTKSLVSLLALQALESDTKEKEKRVNLSMNPNPGTIAEQRFNTAAKRKEKEVIEGVGGVAQQLQAQQMSALPNQMGGVASQPAPNMRMAGGGIVSFAGEDGSKVKGKTSVELLQEVGYTPERFSELTEEQKESVLQTINLKREAQAKQPGSFAPFNQPVGMSQLQYGMSTGANKAGDVSAGMSAPSPNFSFETGQESVPLAGGIPSAVNPVSSIDRVVAEQLDPEAIEKGDSLSYRGQGIDAARKKTVADNMKKTTELSLAEATRDPLAEMKVKQLQADKFQGREDIAKLRGEQTDRVKAQGEKAEEDRENNRFYNLLSRAGGQGALANIGRADTDLKASDAAFEKIELADVLAREDKGVSDDLSISGRSITSGDKAFEMGEAAKSAGLKNLSDLAKTEADNLTKDALGFLKADVENLTEGARYRRELIGVLSTNVTNKLKADIANMQGALEADTNRIRGVAASAKNRESLLTVLTENRLNIGKIKLDYDKMYDKAINHIDMLKLAADEDSKPEYERRKKELRDTITELGKSRLKELEALDAFIAGKIPGLNSGSGNKKVLSTRKAP